MLGKYLAIAHKLYCFLLLYFHFWSCPGGSRNTFSILILCINSHKVWASPATKCWHLMWKIHWGEHHSWGDPFVAKKTVPFYTVVRNRSVWGTRNLTILSFQIKNFWATSRVFMFWVCLPFSFDEEPLENILCICPCNLTASRFPDLVLQNTSFFQVHEYGCLANTWQ